jgi:hypothetical protein
MKGAKMKVDYKSEVIITLQITEKEAIWLKDYMQNAFISDESLVTKTNREALFTALQTVLNAVLH